MKNISLICAGEVVCNHDYYVCALWCSNNNSNKENLELGAWIKLLPRSLQAVLFQTGDFTTHGWNHSLLHLFLWPVEVGRGQKHLDSTLNLTFRGRTSGGTPGMPEWLEVTFRCNVPAQISSQERAMPTRVEGWQPREIHRATLLWDTSEWI